MGHWLAGQRITTTRINVYTEQNEDTTAGRTTTSTSYTDLSGGAFSASVVVPQSGAVLVKIRSTHRNSTTNNSICSWTGSGSSSGTVYSANDNAAIIVNGTNNVSLSIEHLLEGLTVGETLTVTLKYRVNAASTCTADYRNIVLEGAE